MAPVDTEYKSHVTYFWNQVFSHTYTLFRIRNDAVSDGFKEGTLDKIG